jgi:L-ascorbate metabolism protein UlaG (beta-lactamase superfamily)
LTEPDGGRIHTDPVLRTRLAHLRRRASPLLAQWQEKVDAVLISHLHYDHLDLPSLRKLGHSTRVIVPVGAAALLRRHGFSRVEELRAGERTSVRGVPVTAMRAVHNGARGPLGPTAECLGYIIGAGAQRTYFAGDTDLYPEMAQMAGSVEQLLAPLDMRETGGVSGSLSFFIRYIST